MCDLKNASLRVATASHPGDWSSGSGTRAKRYLWVFMCLLLSGPMSENCAGVAASTGGGCTSPTNPSYGTLRGARRPAENRKYQDQSLTSTPQPQNSLLKIFIWTHSSSQDSHSCNKGKQASSVRTFLADLGCRKKIGRLGGWGWKNDPEYNQGLCERVLHFMGHEVQGM